MRGWVYVSIVKKPIFQYACFVGASHVMVDGECILIDHVARVRSAKALDFYLSSTSDDLLWFAIHVLCF